MLHAEAYAKTELGDKNKLQTIKNLKKNIIQNYAFICKKLNRNSNEDDEYLQINAAKSIKIIHLD